MKRASWNTSSSGARPLLSSAAGSGRKDDVGTLISEKGARESHKTAISGVGNDEKGWESFPKIAR